MFRVSRKFHQVKRPCRVEVLHEEVELLRSVVRDSRKARDIIIPHVTRSRFSGKIREEREIEAINRKHGDREGETMIAGREIYNYSTQNVHDNTECKSGNKLTGYTRNPILHLHQRNNRKRCSRHTLVN